MDESALNDAIADLLARTGSRTAGLRIQPCTVGGNNRVYRVEAGGRVMAAKSYFRHPSDPRDRLDSEYRFLQCANASGIECVPGTIARDQDAGIALYDFIEGRRLQPDELRATHVDQARDFFSRLNDAGTRMLGASLPDASEACFSIQEQLSLVDARIAHLAGMPVTSRLEEQALSFINRLKRVWAMLREQVLAGCGRHGIDPLAHLVRGERCISPSDFGFHNAIVTHGGALVFVDFEYAGWDDPAKTVGDFFCQPEIPVQARYLEQFLASALACCPGGESLAHRARLLLPVFQVKWCCIVLNDFLPASFKRRRFADPSLHSAERKRLQLEKAQRIMQALPA